MAESEVQGKAGHHDGRTPADHHRRGEPRTENPVSALLALGGEPAADDVLQEVLISITKSLKTFEGSSNEEFWKWCYRIARRRIYDHIRKKGSDRLEPMPHEVLLDLVDASAQSAPLTAADRHDLEYALKLLDRSKPECRDYLWQHYVTGLAYAEIAEEQDLNYDNVRMKIGRCLDEAKSLVS